MFLLRCLLDLQSLGPTHHCHMSQGLHVSTFSGPDLLGLHGDVPERYSSHTFVIGDLIDELQPNVEEIRMKENTVCNYQS